VLRYHKYETIKIAGRTNGAMTPETKYPAVAMSFGSADAIEAQKPVHIQIAIKTARMTLYRDLRVAASIILETNVAAVFATRTPPPRTQRCRLTEAGVSFLPPGWQAKSMHPKRLQRLEFRTNISIVQNGAVFEPITPGYLMAELIDEVIARAELICLAEI
jgi:hypothetical protein